MNGRAVFWTGYQAQTGPSRAHETRKSSAFGGKLLSDLSAPQACEGIRTSEGDPRRINLRACIGRECALKYA